MICDEKRRLLEQYKLSVRRHADAAAELNRVRGTSSRKNYEKLYKLAEGLRMDAGTAKKELEAHINLHQC